MSDLVGILEDRFSRVAAHFMVYVQMFCASLEGMRRIYWPRYTLNKTTWASSEIICSVDFKHSCFGTVCLSASTLLLRHVSKCLHNYNANEFNVGNPSRNLIM